LPWSCSELLRRLRDLDETSTIEAKTASEVGKALRSTISSFSNEPHLGGGFLLLGVSRQEGKDSIEYNATGVSDPDRIQADLASLCRTAFNKPVRPDIQVERIEGQTVVGVFVPEAEPADKPIYVAATGLPRGAYRRIGSTDQHCTDEDLRLFHEDARGESFDATALRSAKMADVDPEAVELFRRMLERARPGSEILGWTDEKILAALGCLDESGDKVRPNLAGLLLFASSAALRRLLPMTRLDYIRVPGREWMADPDESYYTVEILEPLLRTYQRAEAAVMDDLPVAYSIPRDSAQRKETPLVPRRVVREGIINALMHRDYRVHGPTQIIRYADRLEFRNPGCSLVERERLGQPGSRTRNPLVANVFRDTRLAESKGTGIRAIREQLEAAGLVEPGFESDRSGDVFVLTVRFERVDGEAIAGLDPEPVRDQVGTKSGPSRDQVQLLEFSRESRSIADLMGRLGRSNRTKFREKHLKPLLEVGWLAMTIPDKPRSSKQQYVTTAAGKEALEKALAEDD